MSFTNSLKKIFFLTNLDKNQPQEISKINISLSKNKNGNKNNKEFNVYDKRYYQLNNDLNIYPSPESIKKNKLKPISFKTGAINGNKKNIKQNSQFYLPIMKKSRKIDPIQYFLLEDTLNISKTKKDLSVKYKKMKTQENLNKNEDANNKNDKNEKEIENKNEISTVVSYSFDKNGRTRLKRSCFNLDIYKNNMKKQKIDNFLIKINGKRRTYKEQIMMRNKFQHINNYYKRIMPISNNIQNDSNKLVDFNPENKEMKSYDAKYIYSSDLIKKNYQILKLKDLSNCI